MSWISKSKPPTAEQIRAVMSELGKRTSERKAKASRKNGSKGTPESHRRGGRPRKDDKEKKS